MVLEAGYPNTTGFRKVVKVTVFIKKKAGMSDDAFIAHYNNVHAQDAAPILQRHGIITYSLVIRTPLISSLVPAWRGVVIFCAALRHTICNGTAT